MRKNLGAKSVLYPMPVIVIGSYDENKNPDAMVAAWGGVSDTNELHICVSYEHKSAKNIIKNKEFTVSPAVKKHEKECDYLGMVSANANPNKIKDVKFHTVKAKKVNAPLFRELPFTLECKLIKYDKKTGHLYASIVNVSIDDSILSKNKVDLKKFEPLVFDGMNNTYNVIGKTVGKAFEDYKKLSI